ncbi:tRNA1(Val) (adenine(37)-N6)-methyltransferase [Flagellimonas aequoris]|uniref:tRNA1(Val) (adenine(37)-N6)-methyltransferase n=1 Tax=Flagellimonas aequoris TaxID=2306997 RepID=A0A418NB22_9FLAO|nr:methyltransferase [Allomuricauda aequoris]RIV73661.1 methyltransferase domain-containing protein [Allomuricauda aequoris]TXK07345.1 methyltransferase [Allomuricauda aequoris]
MSKPFQFKEFTVYQDRCAMKVGTDGVLLGAWTSLDHQPETILDVGAGTGLIALQLAQRSVAETIDAIELDEAAYEQCVSNFEGSPWADRLFCYHAGFDEFVDEIEDEYDLIVSNPPFYSEEVASGDVSRDQARQNSSLPFDELMEGVAKLLSEHGRFSVIVPFKEEGNMLDLASRNQLYPQCITRVKGNAQVEYKRSLMEFGFEKGEVQIDELIIETERHQYTDTYIKLTEAFYLKM